jgi:hypothetical protein
MPTALSPQQIDQLKKDALYEMLQDRKQNRLARAARRSWEWGGGKKSATKVAVGLAIGGGLLRLAWQPTGRV